MRAGEIGELLRRTREERGLSLVQAEEETKIRRKYLDALEDGREEEIPGAVYYKGFLRTYANFLGLDGAAIVQEYRQGLGGETREAAAREATAALVVTAGSPPSRKVHPVVRPEARARRFPWLPVLLILIIGGFLAYVFLAAESWSTGTASPQPGGGGDSGEPRRPAAAQPPAQAPAAAAVSPPPSTPTSPLAPAQPPTPTTAPVTAPADTSTSGLAGPPRVVAGAPGPDGLLPFTVSAGPIVVELSFRGDAWIAVQADGKPVFDGTLPLGARRRYTASQELRVRVGWTEMVDVTINGQAFGPVATENNRELVVRAATR